jgi:hypothetical protein
MTEWPVILWGDKTQALFDVWSMEHVLTGVSVGHAVRKHHRKLFARLLGRDNEMESCHVNLAGVLCIGFAWECIEHYLETGLAGKAVEHWFQGVEMWGNRIITDPFMLVLGYLIAKRFPIMIWPARITSLIWLFAHVFLFPHSMYVHELF